MNVHAADLSDMDDESNNILPQGTNELKDHHYASKKTH